MPRRACSCLLALGLACWADLAGGTERAFVSTYESRVLAPGDSELEPWTTFRVGRSRYYSALDGRLELEHGVAPGLQLALYWNFTTQTRDVIADDLTGELTRSTESELSSASLELKYQLSDATADMIGSALYLETTLGPRESEIEGKLILDRSLGKWLLAANLGAEYELESVRGEDGSELETSLVLEPALALGYALPAGFGVGLELRAPLGVAGESHSATLFGGPTLTWADRKYWAALGVEPQLVAFAHQSAGSRLDLDEHERLQIRLIAGFLL
jgi:hypothetical protein